MYELHVSVEEHPTIEQAVKFSALCDEMLGKPLLIQLANGEFPLQLMIARKTDLSTDDEAVTWAQTQAEMIKQMDWNIVRVKVEAPFSAKTYGPKMTTVYNEAHWKTYLTPEAAKDLREFLDKHPDFMYKHSWNVMQEGVHYLTVRSTNEDLSEVFSLFADRGERLTMAGFRPDKAHYERVLYDSNFGLDAGWNL